MGRGRHQTRSLVLVVAEGVDFFLSRVCKIRSHFCLENQFMSTFGLSETVIVFPYG